MISPPEEFSDYWELETYFRKFGGAIRHSIRGSQETASVRTIDDERQQVQDFFYETKDGKMVMNKNKFPTVKYRTVLEAPEPVKTVGQPEEGKKCDCVNCSNCKPHDTPLEESSLKVKVENPEEVKIDSPNPDIPCIEFCEHQPDITKCSICRPKKNKKSKTN